MLGTTRRSQPGRVGLAVGPDAAPDLRRASRALARRRTRRAPPVRWRAAGGEVGRAAGALGGDDHPPTHHGILAQLRHATTSLLFRPRLPREQARPATPRPACPRRARPRPPRRSASSPRASRRSAARRTTVRTPSATIGVPPPPPRARRPRAIGQPSARLRLCEPVQVSTRSPRPARPAKVAGWRPQPRRRAARSRRGPRVIRAARAFSPSSSPSTSPVAMAITFLTRARRARRPPRRGSCTARSAGAARRRCRSERDAARPTTATTSAVGRPWATSRANDGPESTATGRPGSRSARSSDMRRPCCGSRPFVADTSSASRGDAVARPPASRVDEVRRHRDEHECGVRQGLARAPRSR